MEIEAMQSNSHKVKTQKPAHKQETKENKPKHKGKTWHREETFKRSSM